MPWLQPALVQLGPAGAHRLALVSSLLRSWLNMDTVSPKYGLLQPSREEAKLLRVLRRTSDGLSLSNSRRPSARHTEILKQVPEVRWSSKATQAMPM